MESWRKLGQPPDGLLLVCVFQEEQDKGKVSHKQEKESDSDSNSSQPKK